MDDEKTLTIDDVQSMMMKAMGSSQKFHSPSLLVNVGDSMDTYKEVIEKSVVLNHDNTHTTVNDQYGNSLAATGTNDKVQSFTNYGFSNDTLNWPLWLALYNDSWVFRRAIDKPAQDQVNAGFTIHGDEDYTKIYKAVDKHKSDLTQLLMWGALFGGSVAVIMFEGMTEEDYGKPLVQKNIVRKRFKLYVTDRWYGCNASTRTVTSMKDIDYGKPTSYQITFANGKSWKVHHSWVLRYEHRTAPRLIKMGQLMGWGYAEGAHILNELSRDDQLKSSITSLVNKSLIEIIKMKGMRGVFMGSDKGSFAQLQKRLEMVNWGRTYNSLTFLDKDDEYQQYQLTALSGLSDLLEKNMWLVAAALEMQGVLFGDLKGGLSQESDALKRYAITIQNRANAYYRPVLYKFLKILFIVYDVKGAPDFDFNSLIVDEENKAKVDSIKGLSDMLQSLTQNGIISKYQYAKTIKEYVNNNTINLLISDDHLNKLKLEEEQAILETIKEVGKKRNVPMNEPQFNSPYVRREQPIEQQETSTFTHEQPNENNDIGENINNEEESGAAGQEEVEQQEPRE